jgi:hypothetical protein
LFHRRSQMFTDIKEVFVISEIPKGDLSVEMPGLDQVSETLDSKPRHDQDDRASAAFDRGAQAAA